MTIFGGSTSVVKQIVYRIIISEYHTQLTTMSFDKIFDLTARVIFYCNNTLSSKLQETERQN